MLGSLYRQESSDLSLIYPQSDPPRRLYNDLSDPAPSVASLGAPTHIEHLQCSGGRPLLVASDADGMGTVCSLVHWAIHFTLT